MDLLALNGATLINAARAYAQNDWTVLPLKPKDKIPLTAHGLLDGSTLETQIELWWKQWPHANIGLVTGIHFDVLDVDGGRGSPAWDSLMDLQGHKGYKHTGPLATTGKGYHLLFKQSGAKNLAATRPGIDFRGYHGYIVAAPSIHKNGNQYTWIQGGELPEPPSWLKELLITPKLVSDTINHAIPEGDLVHAFEELGCKMIPRGSNFVTHCLFHTDDTPSLTIYPATQSFYCFGCGEWGDLRNLTKWTNTGTLR